MKYIKFPTLYKRSNSLNNINQWVIEVEGNKFRSTTGFVDMKQFIGDWTECTSKNIGKKNSTTPEEQALAEATSMFQKRKELGYWEDINDCDKQVYFSPMLAIDYDKVKKIDFPILSQPKLDGIRCITKFDGMWTRTGKPIISAPHIFESLKPLFEVYPDLILDGELYTSNKDCDFNTIISCVRKTKPTLQDLELSKEYIEYHVYDLPNLDGRNLMFVGRITELSSLLNKFDIEYIIKVPTYTLQNIKEVEDKLYEYIEQGYEGQILRTIASSYQNKRTKDLIKHKVFFDAEFTIVGYAEGVGKFANKLATLKVDVDGVLVDCTINGTMEYLTELFQIKDKLIGKQATIKYFEKTPDGSLRFPKVINIDRESYE